MRQITFCSRPADIQLSPSTTQNMELTEDGSRLLNANENELEFRDLSEATVMTKFADKNYLAFHLIGIALLWPWNSFLSASLYYQHDVFHDTTVYARIYTSTMMTVSTCSSVISNVVLSKIQHSYTTRIVNGLYIQVLVFLLLCCLVVVHRWIPQLLSFLFLMLLVMVSSVATACTQNGITAMANVFGSEYSNSIMVGQAVAGVLPSLVLFVVSLFNSTQEQSSKGIVFYFMTTTVVSLFAIIAYQKSDIPIRGKDIGTSEDGQLDEEKTYIPFSYLFERLRFIVLSIFLTFTVTLIFPVFASNTYAISIPLKKSEYIPFIFMVWNLGDFAGRIAAEKTFDSPVFSPPKIFVYSIARISMIFVFFLFNVRDIDAGAKFGILLDLAYVIWQFLFGFTNGQFISLSFMNVGKQFDTEDERKAAGGVTTVFLSAGLAFGSVLSYLFVYIIAKM